MEHFPTASIVTAPPDAVHTAVVVEVKVTGNPELAVALTETGVLPYA